MSQIPLSMKEALRLVDFCECGTDGPWEVVRAVLERAQSHESLCSPMIWGGVEIPWPWVEFAAKMLDSHGLLEHGGGIGGAWLTDDGEAVLSWLREHGTNSDQCGL